jgi:hypothetical protein
MAFPLTIHPHIVDTIGNFSETLLNEMGFGPEVYTASQTPQVWLNGAASGRCCRARR